MERRALLSATEAKRATAAEMQQTPRLTHQGATNTTKRLPPCSATVVSKVAGVMVETPNLSLGMASARATVTSNDATISPVIHELVRGELVRRGGP